jgi:hypothetical protein
MSPNAFTLLSSLHKTLRSDGKLTFLLRKIDEKKSSVVMKAIDNIISKKARKEGIQRLDNVQMAFGKNWKHDFKLYLLPPPFHNHLRGLFLLPMPMRLRSGT